MCAILSLSGHFSDLKYIDLWLKASKLSLNVAKTEFMVISLRQELQSLNDYTMNINIGDIPINHSNQKQIPLAYH